MTHKTRLNRLKEAFAAVEAKDANALPPIPATCEGRRQMLARDLPARCAEILGPDHPYAAPAHLAGMTLEQLHNAFFETVRQGSAEYAEEIEAFRRLAPHEKILVLRKGDWNQ